MLEENKTLYRQLTSGGNPIYFDPSRIPTIHSAAFLPTSKDGNGLSVIQAEHRTEIWAAYRPEQPEERFRIALVKSSALNRIAESVGFQRLTLETTPDSIDNKFGEPFAHGNIGELNRTAYDNSAISKKQIKEFVKKIADMIPLQDIRGPFPKPNCTKDPVRPTTNLQPD